MKDAAISAVALAATLWQTTPQQRPPSFRSGVDTVAVYATVRGSDGQFASNLQKEDFEILDNGRRREIVAFSNELQPTPVAMVLDRSGSMTELTARVTDGARAFVGKLLPGDRASLSSLAWDCRSLTDDPNKLLAALDRGMLLDLGSPVWRAMDRVMTSLDAEGGRRAVLIFSDGQDTPLALPPSANVVMTPESCRPDPNPGGVSAAQVLAHARQEGMLVYAIGAQGSAAPGSDPGLKEIAKESGGESYAMRADTDLTPAFTAIADELHHQYLLGFVPATFDDKVHTIEVRMKRPGLTVRARKSYVASQGPLTGPEGDARAFDARAPWPEVTNDQVLSAIRTGEAGGRLQASCSAAEVFRDPIETGASVHVVAEGPIGRIMRAAGEGRDRHQRLQASAVTAAMRAPVIEVTARLEFASAVGASVDARPAALTKMQVRGRGPDPIVLVPADTRLAVVELPSGMPGGISMTFAMADFKALPGHEVQVLVSSAAGQRRCGFSKDDVGTLR
jgi:Ca-activated chloride channel family protein